MIQINNEQDLVVLSQEDYEKIRLLYQSLLRREGLPEVAESSLTFVTNQEIRELNREYRNIEKETDVLSFPLYESEDLVLLRQGEQGAKILLLGDIVISLEKAQEQATEFGHSFRRELLYLFVHGLLHLFGYDHLDEDEKREMRSREEEILEEFSITR